MPTTPPCEPGYAVRFRDGSWLAYAHGYEIVAPEEARIARTWATEEAAREAIREANSDWEFDGGITDLGPEVVLGWEPLCASLAAENQQLKAAAKIQPETLDFIEADLRNVLSLLGRTRT